MTSSNDTILPLSNLDIGLTSNLPIVLGRESCNYLNLISSYLKTVDASRLQNDRSDRASAPLTACRATSTISPTFYKIDNPISHQPSLSCDNPRLIEKHPSKFRPTVCKNLISLHTTQSQSVANCLPIVLDKIIRVEDEFTDRADPREVSAVEETYRLAVKSSSEEIVEANENIPSISNLDPIDFEEKLKSQNNLRSPIENFRKKERNRSYRFSAPAPIGTSGQSQFSNEFNLNEPMKHLDPFPSPAPSRRFLGRNSLDSSYRSPREESLPDWVVQEYLSLTHSTDHVKSLLENETQHQFTTRASTDTTLKTHRALNFCNKSRPSSTSFSSSSSSPSPKVKISENIPPPGKVFYTLLDHSQVIEFNKNDVYDFPCLSPVAIMHNSPHTKNRNQIFSSTKILPRFKFGQLFIFKKKEKKKVNL